MNRTLNLILWLVPFGAVIQGLRGLAAWCEACRVSEENQLPFWFEWDVLEGPRWGFIHPAAGRFCHICGADAAKQEPCDAGLHS